ncbi:hypothetical protein ABCS02_05440 [Microbacterium sp. X-17]|uniref:hypothetical protein n=1 Tax=Microbacterium sp. X-17 TaxID=3144404 RepID=UPI0031F4C89D
MSWHSPVASRLVIFENNTTAATSTIIVPAPPGEHSYVSGLRTLTWAIVDDQGSVLPVEARAGCAAYH